jgi:hypothetical protein
LNGLDHLGEHETMDFVQDLVPGLGVFSEHSSDVRTLRS